MISNQSWLARPLQYCTLAVKLVAIWGETRPVGCKQTCYFFLLCVCVCVRFPSLTAGKLGVIASEEEDHPVLVEEAFNSRYVAVFDPLDGSSNIDAAISTGTIFGIFEENEVHFDAYELLDVCVCEYREECLKNA